MLSSELRHFLSMRFSQATDVTAFLGIHDVWLVTSPPYEKPTIKVIKSVNGITMASLLAIGGNYFAFRHVACAGRRPEAKPQLC